MERLVRRQEVPRTPPLLELLWLARAVGRGVRDDVQFRAIMVALTLLLAGGAAFYW